MQALVSTVQVPVPHDQVAISGMAGADDLTSLVWVIPQADYLSYPVVLTVLAHSLSYLAILFFARPNFHPSKTPSSYF